MQSRNIEITVGVFILLGIVALSFLVIQVSGLSFADARRDTYRLSAQFNTVAGLAPRAKVMVAGVAVGHVTAIHIDPVTVRAVVDMAIDSEVDYLTTDSIASIKTAGVLGEQYVSIAVGGAEDILQPGDTIRDTQSAMVLEDLIGKFVTNFGDKK
ncbi:MAG: outer membrane lipid asymmetry maintenance protein MlaD [Halioglobus sp.]|nr:outer membrane lipid asymmetry maintenance protein MlaD [Halioglobus sp.]MCB1708681.1 outer membrane lipid asymmetry maintenance protein MlaD [Halioglobus sp.]MCP5121956.1 outer membrane lipid asymmetry maintenance protein MlaD [Pseudomonadales bacterium]MCP5192505.1 outer membrane lipid asymmetry maintenance protein MlaD [Pseudomonadales bacterium]